ncbi:MAG: hypothetical protein BGO25_06860 [Acidobacteriales bacterium 59-55]|nr:Mov34/MPN/PAD-1 family protein [Terriglobales bacterium]OJV43105.1 MAG: hypothetical protein BGO25_06860 [Acidobacteriales bacterium 59-55]
MAPILNWVEMHDDVSLPTASPEILHAIPPFYAEYDARCLVVLPGTVFDQIMHHIKGNCSVERIGILIGRPCKRPSGEQLLACVEAALPVDDITASRVKVSIQKNGWKNVWGEPALNSTGSIIGWYHSHPNHGVFLSAVDRKTQSLWFAQEWKTAIVIDPIRGEHQAFTGADGIAAPIIFI